MTTIGRMKYLAHALWKTTALSNLTGERAWGAGVVSGRGERAW
jgi:hypothetical protein